MHTKEKKGETFWLGRNFNNQTYFKWSVIEMSNNSIASNQYLTPLKIPLLLSQHNTTTTFISSIKKLANLISKERIGMNKLAVSCRGYFA